MNVPFSEVNAAYPDFIMDNVQLDAKYADLIFEQADSYYAMLDKVIIMISWSWK